MNEKRCLSLHAPCLFSLCSHSVCFSLLSFHSDNIHPKRRCLDDATLSTSHNGSNEANANRCKRFHESLFSVGSCYLVLVHAVGDGDGGGGENLLFAVRDDGNEGENVWKRANGSYLLTFL